MHQKRNRKMVSCDLASFPIKKECKNLMPHWCSEHQGRRSLGSAPQQSRSPSVSIPVPASARDDDSGRQHTVISKRDTNRKNAAPALVISTKAGQPPIGKPLIVQARGQLRLTWKLYAESPQSGEISRPYGTVSMEQETLPPLPAPTSAGDDPWADRFP